MYHNITIYMNMLLAIKLTQMQYHMSMSMKKYSCID